jgi:hypothetical protein
LFNCDLAEPTIFHPLPINASHLSKTALSFIYNIYKGLIPKSFPGHSQRLWKRTNPSLNFICSSRGAKNPRSQFRRIQMPRQPLSCSPPHSSSCEASHAFQPSISRALASRSSGLSRAFFILSDRSQVLTELRSGSLIHSNQ